MPNRSLLLDQVTPRVRSVLVRCRQRAMRGEISEVLHLLTSEIAAQNRADVNRDLVALALLKSELLHLDYRGNESLEVFDVLIFPILTCLKPEERFVIEQNQIDVKTELFRPDFAKDFYHLVDRQRLVGFELYDLQSVLLAQDAAAAGKHHEALPGFWRELLRSYRQCCWRVHSWAAERFARECIQIGLPDEAAYHAMIAASHDLAEPISNDILARRDEGLVNRTIDRLLRFGHLLVHFACACEVLARIGDAIPDCRLAEVTEWLLPRCSLQADKGRGTTGAANLAWKALATFAGRLNPELARRAVGVAVNHPSWSAHAPGPHAVLLEREQIVDTVNHLVSAVRVADLQGLAYQTIPLATDRKQINDYPNVINVLCHIAERAGDPVKGMIGDTLFAPGRVIDFMLGQVAPLFGKAFLPSDRLALLPEQLAGRIRLQVQQLPAGGEPEPVPDALLTMSRQIGDARIVTSLTSSVPLLTLVRHRYQLPRERFQVLIEALVEMLRSRENALSNRASLLHILGELADHMTDELADKVVETIEPLARGEIEEPPGLPTAAENADPLSPVRIGTGTPVEVRGMALYTLAELERAMVGRYQHRLETLLDAALCDPNPEVRRSGFAAARQSPRLSNSAVYAVIMGTLDQDANAATAAFFALANKPEIQLDDDQWHALIYSVRMASNSPVSKLRRNAVYALNRLVGRAPDGTVRTNINNIITIYKNDISSSVRQAATDNLNP